MNEYPFYPDLSEEGKKEAQLLIDAFKKNLKKGADEVIGNFYSNILGYIESDSWQNFRNEIMAGFKNYDNRKIQCAWDFKEIRAQIFKEYREEIIKDLDNDIWEENVQLRERIKLMDEMNEIKNRF
jgi:hypothetical protein